MSSWQMTHNQRNHVQHFYTTGGGGSQNHDDLLVAINSSPPRVARWDFETICANSLSQHSFVFSFCFIIFLFINIYANYFYFLHNLQLISLFFQTSTTAALQRSANNSISACLQPTGWRFWWNQNWLRNTIRNITHREHHFHTKIKLTFTKHIYHSPNKNIE